MKQSADIDISKKEQCLFLILLGVLGLLGCAALIIGCSIAPLYVPDYNWITDTISDLAAGNTEIFMDLALYGFASGLMATALAASHFHLGGKSWSAGILSLAILAALIVIIGARNEYGDSDNEGIVIHIYLVLLLGALFFALPFCMLKGVAKKYTWAKWLLIGLGILWGIVAPVFFLVPTTVDGLVERILGLIACAIIATLCIIFIKNTRA